MARQTWRSRALSLLLAVGVLGTACAVPAAAEPVGDGVTPTYDEAYYATLDYYGNLVEGSVVKSYALHGADGFTDYGAYDEVVNLTDRTAADVTGDTASFRFNGGAPDHFYFEGKTRAPFEDLPWTVTLRYTLNGVPARAEELAGQQGVVEILLDIVPNESAGDYARYNYTLEAMAIFNQDDILSLEAPGAQVQLVGNLRTALFLALPGEEQHFTIRVGSNDFSFGGLTVLMVPATLAQLEEISKLSERKDELEEDYHALSGSLDSLLDALNDIQGGLYASASGLDQLEIARRSFSDGKQVIYDGTDVLRGDLNSLAELLEPVEGRLQILSQTVTDSTALLNELADASLDLKDQLRDVEKALKDLENGTDDVKHILDLAGDLEWSLLRLEDALGGNHIGTNSVSTNSKALVEKVKTVHGAYAAEDQTAFMVKMLEAQGKSSAEAQAQVKSIGELMAAVESGMIPADKLNAEQQAALATAKQMQQLHAAKRGMSFQAFCGQLPGVTEAQAKQMSDLWTIYSSGGNTSNVRPSTPDPDDTKQPGGGTADPGDTEQPGGGATDPDGTNPSGGGATDPDGTNPPSGGATDPDGTNPSGGGATDPDGTNPSGGGTTDPGDTEQPGGGTTDTDGMDAEPEKKNAQDAAIESVPEQEQEEAAEEEEKQKAGGGESLSASLLHSAPADGGDAGENADGGDGTGGTTGGTTGGEGTGGTTGGTTGGEGTGGTTGGTTGGEGTGGTTGGTTGGEGTGGTDTPVTPPAEDSGGTVGGAVIDLITEGLDSATAKVDKIQSQLTNELERIKYPTSRVAGDLADLCGDLYLLFPLLDDAEDLSGALRESTGLIQALLEKTDGLREELNAYEPTLQEALVNAGRLSDAAVTTIRDTEALVADAESLLRTSGAELDEGTRQSLQGLAAALRQTAKALSTTKDVKSAKNTITDIVEDTWNEYTGDVNNLLLMDATAEPVSLTDPRNPAPESVQVLIRTQEIKTEEPEKPEEAEAVKEETTFWDRVVRMFQDLWDTLTGIFR